MPLYVTYVCPDLVVLLCREDKLEMVADLRDELDDTKAELTKVKVEVSVSSISSL